MTSPTVFFVPLIEQGEPMPPSVGEPAETPEFLAGPTLLSLREEFRSELAERYPESLSSDKIVAGGHQPGLYHLGIVAKLFYLEGLADRDSFALFVLLDRDEGDAGEVLIPENAERAVQRAITSSAGVYSEQRLLPDRTLLECFEAGVVSKQSIEPSDQASHFEAKRAEWAEVFKVSESLVEMTERAVSLVSDVSTVRMSELLSFSSTRKFILSFLSEPLALHQTYNNQLKQYRSERKIKNRANPFPNLRSHVDRFELPFWFDVGSRESLWFEPGTQRFTTESGGVSVLLSHPEDVLEFALAPRGAFISLMFRALMFDHFVHGKGGAGYDRFTNHLASQMALALSDYSIVSADALLFPQSASQREELQRMQEQVEGLKKSPDRAEELRHLQLDSERLRELHERKSSLVKALQDAGAKEPETRQQIKKDMSELHREIQATLVSPSEQVSKMISELPNGDLLLARDYPFSLFALSDIEDFRSFFQNAAKRDNATEAQKV